MPYEDSEMNNKQQKHPKVHFEQYLFNSHEPCDDISNDIPPELEAELLENTFSLKGRVRRLARKIRNY